MLQHQPLDHVLHALADPTRRAMVERLVTGPASVSELAQPFAVSLSAIGQHIQLLEESRLVRTQKVGRVRTVELIPETLAMAERWFSQHRAQWERRFDRLGALLAEEDEDLEANPPEPKPRKRKS
jgi:DNA-binding transcriptional ArsR family regulator